MKKPTPKRQAPHSQSSARYKAFRNFARKRLLGTVALNLCPSCKEPKMSHAICAACGMYDGRKVLGMEKKIDKITKIKA